MILQVAIIQRMRRFRQVTQHQLHVRKITLQNRFMSDFLPGPNSLVLLTQGQNILHLSTLEVTE